MGKVNVWSCSVVAPGKVVVWVMALIFDKVAFSAELTKKTPTEIYNG